MIVVGVDASEASKEALRWAVRQAGLTGSPLRAVIAWYIPNSLYMSPMPEGLDFEGDAREALAKAVEEVVGGDGHVQVSQSVLKGHPAPVLVDESATAELLVVGSRGHGEYAGMLLGSVSEHCVANAHCPVVVVRGRTK